MPACPRQWHRHVKFTQRSHEAIKVAGLIDQAARPHFDYFVDCVTELIAAIFDMDARIRIRHVAAVDVDMAAHDPVPPGY
jgi:hypothetical protein